MRDVEVEHAQVGMSNDVELTDSPRNAFAISNIFVCFFLLFLLYVW